MRTTVGWSILSLVLLNGLESSCVASSQQDSPKDFRALYQHASDLHDKGRYREALPLLQKLLIALEQLPEAELPGAGLAMNSLARLHHSMGNCAEAERLFRRALAIAEKTLGPEHPDTARVLNNLGGLYCATGVCAKAEPLYQRALAIMEKATTIGPDHPGVATVLVNLGNFYHQMGDYAEEIRSYQRALAIREKALGPEHPDTATVLNNLGNLYREAGAYAEAEPLFQRALAIMVKARGPDHPNTATVLSNFPALYRAMGAYAKAAPLSEQVLAIREKALGLDHPDTATSLINLAVLRWAMDDAVTALSLFERGQAVMAKNTERLLLSGSELRKKAYFKDFSDYASLYISFSLVFPGRQAIPFALTSVLQTKGHILDAMSDTVGRLQRNESGNSALFDQLAGVTQQLSNLTYQGQEGLDFGAYRQRLQELAFAWEQLEAELSARSAEFHRQVSPVTLAAIQALVPKSAALIEWYRYQPFNPKAKSEQSERETPRYVAYVLKHESEPAVVDVGEAESIDQLIQDFQAGLSDRTSTYVKEVAKDLYAKLYKPMQQHLGDVKQLLISPDGAVNLLPFAALLDETGTYLGSKKEITYLTSGGDLLRLETPSVGKGQAIIVADPDYGKANTVAATSDASERSIRSADLDREGLFFQSLPGTAEEAKTLKTLIKISDDQVLTQARATEERFKQLHRPRILHIATHGFFLKDNDLPTAALKRVGFSQDHAPVPLGENPLLRSGLALAGANLRRSGEKDDGILTAAEVAQMDLRGTQLVVLSACETGVGEVQNGEGVYGLRRALVLAGAETQVTSLWKVADDATKDLMVDYYKRLLKGEGRSEALRNAQLTMMNSKDRSHPYYWAAFVPIGDWRPLSKER